MGSSNTIREKGPYLFLDHPSSHAGKGAVLLRNFRKDLKYIDDDRMFLIFHVVTPFSLV